MLRHIHLRREGRSEERNREERGEEERSYYLLGSVVAVPQPGGMGGRRSIQKYLLNTCQMPGTSLGAAGDTAMNEENKNF